MREWIGEYGQTIVSIVGAGSSILIIKGMLSILVPVVEVILQNMM